MTGLPFIYLSFIILYQFCYFSYLKKEGVLYGYLYLVTSCRAWRALFCLCGSVFCLNEQQRGKASSGRRSKTIAILLFSTACWCTESRLLWHLRGIWSNFTRGAICLICLLRLPRPPIWFWRLPRPSSANSIIHLTYRISSSVRPATKGGRAGEERGVARFRAPQA